MKIIRQTLLSVFFLLCSHVFMAQVGISPAGGPPDSSAGLDVNFTDRGLLPPRMTTAQRDAIASPAEGLQIYNLDCHVINYNAGPPSAPNWVTLTASNTLVAAVSISASPQGAVCQGESITYSASPVNGGGSPQYQWKRNGADISGASGSTYLDAAPVNGDVITCVMTTNEPCVIGSPAASNSITTIVNPSLTAGVSITASPSGPICPGSEVTFTASPENGGSAPTFAWLVNNTEIEVGTSNEFSTSAVLFEGDVVFCRMTSSEECATGSPAISNEIEMSVNPSNTAGVSIAASPSGPVCSGVNVTFTATPSNGGSSPSYQWKKGGVDISGANSSVYASSSLSNGDVITCVMTSNEACVTGSPATSNSVTISMGGSGSGSQTLTASGSGPTGTIQSFTVPECVTSLTIEAWGGSGGTTVNWPIAVGGKGARIKGTISVTPGEVLKVLVGHAGGNGSQCSGGGGGTFVTTSANVPLIIAGGGGGGGYANSGLSPIVNPWGKNGETGNNGSAGYDGNDGPGGAGGTAGGAGDKGYLYGGCGGGGLTGSAVAGLPAGATGGQSFISGGTGGGGGAGYNGFGGFGGGGGNGDFGGGGGGGYSGGGGGGPNWSTGGGGGGGSYNAGTNQSNTIASTSGHGQVIFTW